MNNLRGTDWLLLILIIINFIFALIQLDVPGICGWLVAGLMSMSYFNEREKNNN